MRWLHQFTDPADQEIVGVLASSLAYGAVPIIQAAVGDALARLDGAPARTMDRATPAELRARFAGFRHRFHDGLDVALLLTGVQTLRRRYGTLGTAFATFYKGSGTDLREGLAQLVDQIRTVARTELRDGPTRNRHAGIWHSLADPRRGSACKRWNLYLRWMVRPSDGVDLGLWDDVDPAHLVMPVDTHVARIARFVGLTERATADWTMAEQITDALRAFDPADPVKYDFAISRLGILKECRSTREASICSACPLDPVCCLS